MDRVGLLVILAVTVLDPTATSVIKPFMFRVNEWTKNTYDFTQHNGTAVADISVEIEYTVHRQPVSRWYAAPMCHSCPPEEFVLSLQDLEHNGIYQVGDVAVSIEEVASVVTLPMGQEATRWKYTLLLEHSMPLSMRVEHVTTWGNYQVKHKFTIHRVGQERSRQSLQIPFALLPEIAFAREGQPFQITFAASDMLKGRKGYITFRKYNATAIWTWPFPPEESEILAVYYGSSNTDTSLIPNYSLATGVYSGNLVISTLTGQSFLEGPQEGVYSVEYHHDNCEVTASTMIIPSSTPILPSQREMAVQMGTCSNSRPGVIYNGGPDCVICAVFGDGGNYLVEMGRERNPMRHIAKPTNMPYLRQEMIVFNSPEPSDSGRYWCNALDRRTGQFKVQFLDVDVYAYNSKVARLP